MNALSIWTVLQCFLFLDEVGSAPVDVDQLSSIKSFLFIKYRLASQWNIVTEIGGVNRPEIFFSFLTPTASDQILTHQKKVFSNPYSTDFHPQKSDAPLRLLPELFSDKSAAIGEEYCVQICERVLWDSDILMNRLPLQWMWYSQYSGH